MLGAGGRQPVMCQTLDVLYRFGVHIDSSPRDRVPGPLGRIASGSLLQLLSACIILQELPSGVRKPYAVSRKHAWSDAIVALP